MKAYAKVGVVLAGYAAALAIASAAVAIRIHDTHDTQGADGMYAFGDLVLFVAVFGVLALIPTGAGIFFLMARRAR